MNIQWYPGHMAKATRELKEKINMIDVVVEITDARIPLSSRNPEVQTLIGVKKHIIVLNKEDLADPKKSQEWIKYHKDSGIYAVLCNSNQGKGIKEVTNKIIEAAKEKSERAMQRGRRIRPVKTMIVGIPNSGKSAFINKIAGKVSAKTGNKPGVTKAQQWIRINPQVQLLDTPGILWPKFEDPTTGENLAYTGAIRDEIMDTAELALKLLERLAHLYPNFLENRYKIILSNIESDNLGLALLETIGKKRGCIVSGGSVDYNRVGNLVLDEFRSCKIGRITLESP